MRVACVWQVFAAFIFLKWGLSVQYIPERTVATYLNDKYIYNGTVFISRYGRKSPYYYNIQAGTRHIWGNNITIHMLFYEYRNNQYHRTFVELHLRICDLLNKDPYFGKMFNVILARYKISCPIPAGMYEFRNLTLPSEGLPNILPFEKGKVDATVRQQPSQDLIASVYICFQVKK